MPSRRILIVDDDPNFLLVLEASLSRVFEVDTARGADEGLRRIAADGPYAAVVSDMYMEGLDGIAFLTLVAEKHPESLRFMLTGRPSIKVVAAAVNEGRITGIFDKAESFTALAKKLIEAIDAPAAGAEERPAPVLTEDERNFLTPPRPPRDGD